MKALNLMVVVVVAGMCAGLGACGGHSGGTTPTQPSQPTQPPPPTTMTLDVNDVLMKAKVRSETDDPFDVNGGMVALAPLNDEESDPASVD